MKLGVSTYSYWHFAPEKVPIETVIHKAAELNLDGIEILHKQMATEDNLYVQNLKREAFLCGLDLYALSIHQGLRRTDEKDAFQRKIAKSYKDLLNAVKGRK